MPLDEATLFVSALRLRARLGKAQDRMADAVSALERAKAAQTNILARVRIEAVELVGEQKRSAAELCHQLGEYHELGHDADGALAAYSEAVGPANTHGPSMLALARVHLSRAELEPAEKLCTTLMSLEPNNNDAALLLADVMAQRAATSGKGEWDAATYHIEQMLEKAPTNYRATAQLIQLLRRAGRIGDAAKYLTLAERYSSKAPLEPGWRYCRGVLCRYQNDPRAALAALNTARRDAEWGDAALHHMVEIFLHPEDEDVNWEELNLDAGPGEPTDAARAAEHLLREMRPSPRATVLECYTMLSYKSKARVERAVSTLLELLNTERDFLPALVCLSQAYLMIKQAPKARNYLKRVAKMPFVFEMADDFEKVAELGSPSPPRHHWPLAATPSPMQGWLMLAEVYITSGKYDLAEELCRKCLGANKSCAKVRSAGGPPRREIGSPRGVPPDPMRDPRMPRRGSTSASSRRRRCRTSTPRRTTSPHGRMRTRRAPPWAIGSRSIISRRRSTSRRSTCATRCSSTSPTTRRYVPTSWRRRERRSGRERRRARGSRRNGTVSRDASSPRGARALPSFPLLGVREPRSVQAPASTSRAYT